MGVRSEGRVKRTNGRKTAGEKRKDARINIHQERLERMVKRKGEVGNEAEDESKRHGI